MTNSLKRVVARWIPGIGRILLGKDAYARRLTISVVGFLAGLMVVSGMVMVEWDRRVEYGYVAFNQGAYAEARELLALPARFGDRQAQQLLAYMAGLGLGQPVDITQAIAWMTRHSSRIEARQVLAQSAGYLGADASRGLYGEGKKELGKLWLDIAQVSGAPQRERVAPTSAAAVSNR